MRTLPLRQDLRRWKAQELSLVSDGPFSAPHSMSTASCTDWIPRLPQMSKAPSSPSLESRLSWVGAGFPLGSVVVILFLTALYADFNMKWTYTASVLIFGVGSALCGAAPGIETLIVGRIIAGAGGSGTYIGCLSYISAACSVRPVITRVVCLPTLQMTSPTERGLYVSLSGLSFGVGIVLGPRHRRRLFRIVRDLALGFLHQLGYRCDWSSGFPLLSSSCPPQTSHFEVDPARRPRSCWLRPTRGHMGPLHNSLYIRRQRVALEGRPYHYSHCAMGAVLVAYALQQWRAILTTKQARSFPCHLLRSRTQILLYVTTSANITAFYIIAYFIPIYFQFVHDDSAIKAAIRLLPYVIITCFFNVVAGVLLPKVKVYMPIFVLSGILLCIGGSLLTANLDPSTGQATIYGLTVVLAAGSGLTLQTGYTVATILAPEKHVGDAISLQNISQIGSSLIALVIAGQVFQSSATESLYSVLAGKGLSQQEITGVIAGAQSPVFQGLSAELKSSVILAITKAMQKSFSLLIVAGGVMLLTGLVMKRERLFENGPAI